MRRHDLRPLLGQLQNLDNGPGAQLRYGTITAINSDGTVDLQLAGDTETTLTSMNVANNRGVFDAGDVVAVLKSGQDVLVMDRLNDSRGPCGRWSLASGNSPTLSDGIVQFITLSAESASSINYEYPDDWPTGDRGSIRQVPESGIYRIDVQAGFNNPNVTTENRCQVEIYRNPTSLTPPFGGTQIGEGRGSRNEAEPFYVYGTYTGPLEAGDYVGMAVRTVGVGGFGLAENAYSTYMQITWIRPLNTA